MADYNSHAAASTNVFMGRFFNVLSAAFTANHKTQSTAPKTPSKNLAVGLVKILRKRGKGQSETASNHRAVHRLNREEQNLGSMEWAGPYQGPVPIGIQRRTGSNRVSAGSSAWGIGLWASSGLGDPVPYPLLLILVIVSVLVGISCRFSKGSGAKSLVGSHTGWALRAIPLVLTLILHCLSSSEISKIKSQILGNDADHSGSSSERFFFKKGSLTPWALAALVVLLFFMAQYQSEWRIRWFV
ncbi:hypothetical protein SLA2020_274410 [Shorea laevis]